MRIHNTLMVLAVAAVLTPVAVLTPAAAQAGQKPVPAPVRYLNPDVTARMLAQQPLKAAAGRIERSAGRTADGYAGVGLGDGEVVVWWKGDLPQQVERTIADVRRTTRVRVVAAEHSRAELEAAAKGVENYLRAHPDSPYHGVTISYDGSGLSVLADPGSVRTQGVPTEMKIPTGIKASVVEREAPKLTGRLNDYAPYWGGGRIQNNDNGAFCTAGFPVTAGGANYMLTAGHCGRPGGTWNNGNDTRFFGTGAYEHMAHDLLLISASTHGRIWDGGVGVGEFTKGVAGWDYVWAGEWLCTSGSVSGALCNHVVSNEFFFSFCDYDAYGNWECFNDLIISWQWDGWTASRPGDSGGPVFGLWGTDRVIAKGTITGYIGSNGLIFQDFATAYYDFGVVPLTN